MLELRVKDNQNPTSIQQVKSQDTRLRSKRIICRRKERAAALEFEEILLAKYSDKFSRYHIRFWVEMLANGDYSDLDTPSAGAAMFHCETAMKRSKTENSNDTFMNGMLTVVNTQCQALVPQCHDQASPAQ